MTTRGTQYSYRATWAELSGLDSAGEPVPYWMTDDLRIYDDPTHDPEHGMTPSAMVDMARNHVTDLEAEHGDLRTGVTVVVDERIVFRNAGKIETAYSWHALATVTADGVEYPARDDRHTRGRDLRSMVRPRRDLDEF